MCEASAEVTQSGEFAGRSAGPDEFPGHKKALATHRGLSRRLTRVQQIEEGG